MDWGDDTVIKALYLKVWWLTSDPSNPCECREDLSGWSGRRLGFRASNVKSNQELHETSTSCSPRARISAHNHTHAPSRAHTLTHKHTEGEKAFIDTQDYSFDLDCLPKAPVVKKCSFLPWLCPSGGNFKGWDLMGGLGFWALCVSTMIGWLTVGPKNGAKWAQTDSEISCLLTF